MNKRLLNFQAVIAGLFTISTFFVLAVYWGTDYTDLFNKNYVYYYVTALATIGLVLLAEIFLIFKNRKVQKRPLLTWEWTLLIFVIVSTISTLLSEYRFEAFWGNEGRYNGLFLMLLYCITTFIIGTKLKMSQWYLDVLLAGGIFVSVVGIADFFYVDLLNIKQEMVGLYAYEIFTSTMGNINFYTAYVGLILGCAAGLFLVENNRYRACYYYLSYIIAFFALITGTSDNGYLSLGAILGLLPLYAFRSKHATKRFLLLGAASSILLQIIAWVHDAWEGQVIPIESLLTELGDSAIMFAVSLFLVLLVVCTYIKWTKTEPDDDQLPPLLRRLWTGLIVLVILAVLYLLYDANIAGNGESYGSLQKYLRFNDEWGTRRGYAWRIAWEYYVSFTPLQMLFGYGFETYPILNIYNHKWEMAYVMESFYDSVHNEYLQYLISIGIIGVLSYLMFFAAVLKTMLKQLKETPYLIAIIISLVAYWLQAIVNISTVYVAGIMWALIAVGMAACRPEKYDDDNSDIDSVPPEATEPFTEKAL